MPDLPESPSPAEPGAAARPTLAELGWSDRVEALAASSPHAREGVLARVVRVNRKGCVVVSATEESAAIGFPLPAVGDWVLVARTDPNGPLQVVDILPRWSALERHAAAGATEVQVLAVNVDLVFIVISLDAPLKGGRLDRELVVAWESGAQPVIVLTKADQHPDPDAAAAEAADRSNGVPVIVTSAVDGRGVEDVRAVIGPTDTLVLLGASGVGKSTLANRLLGAEVLQTGEVRDGDRKGRHTTTSRYLLGIPSGGVLVDTPGLRGLGLWDVAEGMSLAFSDIEELAEGCRFNDCAHGAEPGCAVRAAVAAGTLSPARFESWQKLQAEAAHVEVQRDARAKADDKRKTKEVMRAQRKQYEERPRGRR